MKYNIICHDGKSFEITEEQKEKIIKISVTNSKGADVNGNFITFSNIARIEKSSSREYKKLPEVRRTYKKEQHIKNLETLKEGYLTGVADRNNLKKNQTEFIERIDFAIKNVINSTKEKFTVNNKLFGY